MLEFSNTKPVKVPYKGITLLGDKISLTATPGPEKSAAFVYGVGDGSGRTMQPWKRFYELQISVKGRRMLEELRGVFSGDVGRKRGAVDSG